MKVLLTSGLILLAMHMTAQIPQHITINYDKAEENNVATYARFGWDFNSRYTYPPYPATYQYAIVAFDSLHDVDTDMGYSYDDEVSQLSVDTIHFSLGHVNLSGQNDTVVISEIALNVQGYPTNTVLWADSIITDSSLTGPSWLNFSEFSVVPPNLDVTPPSKIGVTLEYFGPFIDTAGFLAGYTDASSCPSICFGPSASLFGNSYHYYNGDSVSPSGMNLLYVDCDLDTQQDLCETGFIQNVGIWIDVTIETPGAVGDRISTLVWNAFPNPTSGRIMMDLPEEVGEATIEVRNSLGQPVLPLQRVQDEQAQLDLSPLSSGWYTIMLRTSDGVDYRLVLRQ